MGVSTRCTLENILKSEAEILPFRACAIKIRYRPIALIYVAIAEIPASYGISGSRNTMVMSDFRPGVEIWPFRACAVNMQYNPCYKNPCYRNNLVVVQLL